MLNKIKNVVNSIVRIWTEYVLFVLDILEEPTSLSYIEPNWDPERVASQDIVDPSDSEICQAIKIPSAGLSSVSHSPPTVWFSSRLSELDAQLAALQNIADYLETDFTNSRMVHMHFIFIFSMSPKLQVPFLRLIHTYTGDNSLLVLHCLCVVGEHY